MTDTGAYSDVVFGLFRLAGYRFSPRLADIGGTRFWRIDRHADYGPLDRLARHRINIKLIIEHGNTSSASPARCPPELSAPPS